jgi:hypothetical protein
VIANSTISLMGHLPGQIAQLLAVACAFATFVLMLLWLHAAWQGVPVSHRGTVTPLRAASRILIPLYGFYWGVAINLALCDTLDGILASARSDRRAPRRLAIAALVGWFGGLVAATAIAMVHRPMPGFTLVMPVARAGLWVAYMFSCERTLDAVAELSARGANLGEPRLSRIQRRRGPGVVGAIAWVVVFLLGVAVYLVLVPPNHAPRRRAAPSASQ